MSTIKVNNITNANGTSAIAIDSSGVATFSKTLVPSSSMMYRNLIINGAMQVAQRATIVSGQGLGGYITVDRWSTSYVNPSAVWTHSQDTDVPSGQGFGYSFKMQCTTASAVGTNERLMVGQRFEGQMLQHLKKGTANAESLTLSFWVKSNKTGTYIANLYDTDNTRQISKAYTISSADTWEKKIITFAGDTTGTLDNDNNQSFILFFGLAVGTFETSGTLQTSWGSAVGTDRFVGQVNLGDAVNNYINITGIQLEVGDAATPFEHRPYDAELARCQRYYVIHNSNAVGDRLANGQGDSTSVVNFIVPVPTILRTYPVCGFNNLVCRNGVTNVTISSLGGINYSTTSNFVNVYFNTVSSVQGAGYMLRATDADGYIEFGAEL